MPTYKINVKWQKDKFCDIECNTDETPDLFKAMLFSLTGVPPERQKVMMPGKLLESSWDGIKLRNGANIMLLGTAEQVSVTTDYESIPSKSAFVEQKPPVLPFGIVNLGNTCYMSATIQLLYTLPELRLSLPLCVLSSSTLLDGPASLNTSLKLLFDSMSKAEKPITPACFLVTLHTVCPQFSTRMSGSSAAKGLTSSKNELMSLAAGISGGFQQQDANECWTELIRVLQKLKTDNKAIEEAKSRLPSSIGSTGGWNPIDRYLTGHIACKLRCSETDDEPESEISETFTQLSCFINKDVKYLHTGIRSGFEGSLTKHSSVLGKDAVFKKESRISRLPGYLSVQFVRFFYKEKEQINAKVLKDVKFPLTLDLYEFCTPQLQQRLLPMREKIRLEEEEELSTQGKKREKLLKNRDLEPNQDELEPYWFEDDFGSNNSGIYDLIGVVTHQGRSSSSGHYVAWVKRKGIWLKFDDDEVSQVTSEDILRLSGGGDWHCAYVLLYGPKQVRIKASANTTTASSDIPVSSAASGGKSLGGDE